MVDATLTIGWKEAQTVILLKDYHWEGDNPLIVYGSQPIPRPRGIPTGSNEGDLFLLQPQKPDSEGRYSSNNPFHQVASGLESHFGDHEVGQGTLHVSGSRVNVPVYFLKVPEVPYRRMNRGLTHRLQQVEPSYQAPTQHQFS